MGWSATLHKSVSWELLGPIELASTSADRVLNDVSEGTHSVILEAGFEHGPALCSSWTVLLAIRWNGRPKYIGYNESITGWNRETRELTFRTRDVRDHLAFRQTYQANADSYRAGDFYVAGVSYATAVRQILERTARGPSQPWNLPCTLPGVWPGPVSFLKPYWESHTGEAMLTELQERADGPDIDFEPTELPDGTPYYLTRVGTPRLSGPDIEVNLGAPETPVSAFNLQINGQNVRTGSVALGKGTEADMRIGFANSLPGDDIPVRDGVESHKEIAEDGLLIGHAYADLGAHRGPTEQYDLALQLDENDPDGYFPRLGTRLSAWVVDHPKYVDGWQDLYVIGMKFDKTHTVTLTVQPYREPE